ncbi:TIGR03745 family integrating conjugative element membrane protein [Pseudomonas aeruginosa]|uniref:TIGR03745 family integrating conjugative element membrane protein n=1 Tax=Pseudomonas aeruginosa TaxID=287 RepID=UPI00104590FE
MAPLEIRHRSVRPISAKHAQASRFLQQSHHAYGTYAEIHTGRKTWGQFGLTVAIGAVLLVIGIWLLTEATGIL